MYHSKCGAILAGLMNPLGSEYGFVEADMEFVVENQMRLKRIIGTGAFDLLRL